MAQQAAVKRADTIAEKAPAKASRPVGKEPKSFDYSRYRVSFRDDKDFQAYVNGYPDKTGILAYIYRIKPAIDMSLVGIAENSILKTSTIAEMTSEFIGARFGRGKYLLKFTDANRPKGETQVATTWLTCDDPDLPPIYDPATLKLGEPDNQDEISRLLQTGVLVRDSATGQPRLRRADDTAAPVPPPSQQQQQGGAGDLFGRDLIQQVVAKALANAGGMSPGDSMKQALEIAKLMQTGTAAPQLNVDQIAEVVTARLERTLGTRPTENGLFENYERVDAFIQKVRGVAAPVVAANGEGAGSGTLGVVRELVGELKGLVPEVISGYIQLQQFKAMQQQNRRQPTFRRPAAPQVQGQNGAAPPPQASMSLPQRIEEIAAMGFEKMDAGVSGFDFAAFICNYHPGGLEVFRLVAPHGVPAVTGLAAMNPRFAKYFTPEKREAVETFLSDFFSFDPDGGAAEEEAPLQGEVVNGVPAQA